MCNAVSISKRVGRNYNITVEDTNPEGIIYNNNNSNILGNYKI